MSGRAVRARVHSEVLARQEDITDAVLTRIVAEIPAYAALARGQVDEVRAIAAWGTQRILDLWVEGGALSPADLRRFRGIGAARALDGRPLPAVLRAYRLAGQEVTTAVEGVGGDRLSTADVMDMARLWMGCIDELSEAIYAGYAAATERVSGDRTDALGDLLDDLLVGRQVTRTALADRARELGITVGDRVTLLMIAPRVAHSEMTPEALHTYLSLLDHVPQSGVPLRVRDGIGTALLPLETTLDSEGLGQRTWVGCAFTSLTASQLPSRRRLGENLLRRAPDRAFADGGRLLDESDAHAVGLLSRHADADAERLDALVLADLRTGGHDHLLQGLEAYLTAGSATDAAELLGVHAQTMRYRLKRLRELTGRDPRNGWDRLVLEAALVAGSAGRRFVTL